MSETASHSHNQVIAQHVSGARFAEVQASVETGKRVKAALMPDHGAYDRGFLDQIRQLEHLATARVDGKREVQIDVRGCRPVRFDLRFESETGESLTQEVVTFLRPDGIYVYPEGDPLHALALNADVYDARMQSHSHPVYRGFDTSTLPSVGTQGEFTGIYTLYEDKRA